MAYEIMGGNLDSLSYFDGGPDEFLESCDTLEKARAARDSWQNKNYVAYIVDADSDDRAIIN